MFTVNRSALHWGAKRNHKAVVQYLLSHGADIEAVDNDGKKANQLTTDAEVHSLLGGKSIILAMMLGRSRFIDTMYVLCVLCSISFRSSLYCLK